MTVKQKEKESFLLAESSIGLAVSGHTGTSSFPTPHFATGKNKRRKSFPTKYSCCLKPCALSEATIALCGKCGGSVLKIKIYFSVFSET